jgi:hypothetical protein
MWPQRAIARQLLPQKIKRLCAGGPLAAFMLVKRLKDGEVEYWAAATLNEKALAAVAKQVGPDWIVTSSLSTGHGHAGV